MANLLVILIKDPAVQERRQGEFTFRTQTGIANWPNGDRVSFEIPLPRARELGYPAGAYTVGGASFEMDKYKRLMIGRGLVLEPTDAK